MRLPLNTITKRLFLSLGILVFNTIIISCLSLYFLGRTVTISKIGQKIDSQRILTIQLIKTDLDFLRFETVNHVFYETGQSSLLEERDSLFKLIKSENEILYNQMTENQFLIDYQFHQIDSFVTQYNATFQLLIVKINERGFKDYGLEGIMRNYAHLLESMDSHITLTELLTLRRHEKDFLLRKEDKYIRNFNNLANRLTNIPLKDQYVNSINALKKYQSAFNQLTKLNYEIGIVPTEGLLGQLNTQTKLISMSLQHLTELSNERKDEVIQKSAVLFSAISFFTIIFSTLLTYFTSIRLAKPIKKLSLSMGKFIVNEGIDERELETTTDTNEINNLSQSFIKLSRKLKAQFGEIQQKSHLLEKQNEELKKLNEELDRFIYSAAHDLKSPLTSLDGLIRLAKIEINSTKDSHYFEMMGDAVHKLYGFILDITDYAKNKRQKLRIEKVELKVVLQDIIESLKFLPSANRIHVDVHLEGDEIFVDKTRLEIVLKNIISNSFRYADLNKSKSYLKIEGNISKQKIKIQITDNGIGIANEHLPKIFDMFYRAVDHSKGTGIGLFLVKESVNMLKGRISVKSVLGESTIFYLDIPNHEHKEDSPPIEVIYAKDKKVLVSGAKE